ncbi:MAG: AbrB/MazE/SpoVT family DNA-binding domain-containing protein [Candidatus Omnitrophica bacterium]|nr:AbrB/MazE/SpoVT family DNA-binding domain-containing protein [Candidatus Omnitrophota bacterium]
MALAKMTSKGQVTIPKEIRDCLHIKPKDRLVFTVDGDHLLVHSLHGNILGLKGAFHRKGMKRIDFKALRRQFEGAAAQRVVRILERSRSG